jgi:amino acid permease
MKNMRPMGWVIIVVNALLLINFFTSVDPNNGDAVTGFAFIFTMFLMAIINVPLYIIYRVTGNKGRTCPACGVRVRVGLTECQKCNFDFKKQAGQNN